MTPARGQAQPGPGNRIAKAAGTRKIAQSRGRANRAAMYNVTPENGDAFTLYATGREVWALERLIKAGPKGCTPIEQPAPRWSSYVHLLRGRGVPIDPAFPK